MSDNNKNTTTEAGKSFQGESLEELLRNPGTLRTKVEDMMKKFKSVPGRELAANALLEEVEYLTLGARASNVPGDLGRACLAKTLVGVFDLINIILNRGMREPALGFFLVAVKVEDPGPENIIPTTYMVSKSNIPQDILQQLAPTIFDSVKDGHAEKDIPIA